MRARHVREGDSKEREEKINSALIAVPKVRFLRFLRNLPTGEDESQCYHVLDVRHGKRINIRELDDLFLRVATTTRKVVRFENQVIE